LGPALREVPMTDDVLGSGKGVIFADRKDCEDVYLATIKMPENPYVIR